MRKTLCSRIHRFYEAKFDWSRLINLVPFYESALHDKEHTGTISIPQTPSLLTGVYTRKSILLPSSIQELLLDRLLVHEKHQSLLYFAL